MDLINILHCNKEFFELLRTRPQGSLPSIAWDGNLIYFGSNESVVNLTEVSPKEKLEQLKAIYPDIGPFEILRLHSRIGFPQAALCAHLHIPLKEENELFFSKLIQVLPREVQDHFDERKVKIPELVFLRALADSSDSESQKAAFNVTLQISKFALSLQSSLKSLETMMDLFLMGKPIEALFAANNATEFQNALFQNRNPVSQQIQEAKQSQMSLIHWPSFAKAKVTRRGDRTGFEVQTFIASEADLTKMIATFERMKEHFENSKESFVI